MPTYPTQYTPATQVATTFTDTTEVATAYGNDAADSGIFLFENGDTFLFENGDIYLFD